MPEEQILRAYTQIALLSPRPNMIRLTRCNRPDHAREYFALHLSTGDNQAHPTPPPYSLQASWTGPALTDVGIASNTTPVASQLVRLGRGLHPTARTRLAPVVNRKRAYHDLTISPPKTISLGALLQPYHPTAQAIAYCHLAAVRAVTQAVAPMILPRSGTGPGKWLGAIFHHTHTREGDPHLHTHVILPNVTINREGQWRAMQVNIAGLNRTRLELTYGHELARQLRRRGLGAEIEMLPSGLPELRPLKLFAGRFSRARQAILSAAKATDAEQPDRVAKARVVEDDEMHRRSGMPVPPDRPAMQRRQRLADQIRRPKPKNADDPVRLTAEADRWRATLSAQDNRTLLRLLDDADLSNPRRPVRVIEKMPPSLARVVRAAYDRLPLEAKPTSALLMRAAVEVSAGRHELADLAAATKASLIARKKRIARIRAQQEEDSLAIAQAEYAAIHHPQPTTVRVTSAADAVTPARTSRGARR